MSALLSLNGGTKKVVYCNARILFNSVQLEASTTKSDGRRKFGKKPTAAFGV
jgi:hypothetical protein